MGKTATNLSIVLGLITVAFAGYYMYTQQASTTLLVDDNQQTMQDMLKNTRVFIQHRQALESVEMDISLFEDERFRSLRSFSTPILERPVGRSDPFADVNLDTSAVQ